MGYGTLLGVRRGGYSPRSGHLGSKNTSWQYNITNNGVFDDVDPSSSQNRMRGRWVTSGGFT